MDKKRKNHEQQVFREFVEAERLNVDQSTIECRQPPEPDILCICNGSPVYFELGRIFDPYLGKLRNLALSLPAGTLITPNTSCTKVPERLTLEKKLSKRYKTDGNPVELLLYHDAENFRVAGPIPPVDFTLHAKTVMEPLLEQSPTKFRRVWVFERYRKSVIWRYPSV